MTASLQLKNDTVYVVLNWKQGTKRKQKWIPTDLPIKYGKRAGESVKEKTLAEWRQKVCPNYKEMSFSEFLKDWLERKKPSIEESTYRSYKRMINNTISPYFDERGISLQDCGVAEIEGFYRHKETKDGVSANTISHYQAAIYSALKDAVRLGVVSSNPAERVILPKVKKFQGSFYTAEEAQALLGATVGTKLERPVYLACWFGLRRGEATGLRWKDINFSRKTMSITGVIVQEGTSNQYNYRDHPKSKAGERIFPLTDEQCRVMQHWKIAQAEQRLLCGKSYNTEWQDFVCVDKIGNLITPGYISWSFPKFLRKNELRVIRFHDLRHTNAVLLLSNGATMQSVQNWLGHESYATTDEYYGGLLADAKIVPAQILGSVLGAQDKNAANG